MILAPALLACAPTVSPVTMQRIVQVESGGNWLAIHDNFSRRSYYPRTYEQAVAWARWLSARGHSIDLGLGGINNRNLPRLGYTIEQMFNPCINIQASGRIITKDYISALGHWKSGQQALLRSLSSYNTGNPYSGFKNGYVARYDANARFDALVNAWKNARAPTAPAPRPTVASDDSVYRIADTQSTFAERMRAWIKAHTPETPKATMVALVNAWRSAPATPTVAQQGDSVYGAATSYQTAYAARMQTWINARIPTAPQQTMVASNDSIYRAAAINTPIWQESETDRQRM